MLTTLIINDDENSENLAFVLGFMGLHKHWVKAIYPVIEYAIRILKEERWKEEVKFIVIDSPSGSSLQKISMTNTLSRLFPDLPILFVDTLIRCERTDMPNIHDFIDLEGAGEYIRSNSA